MKKSLGVKRHLPVALVSIFLFLFSLLIIGQNLDKPFWGEHDWNGVRYGNIARNYFKYGLINLKFAQVENSGPINGHQIEYFTHYPPLFPILISLSYKIFGISEWSTRLVPLLASSGSILLIFLIGTKLWDFKTGFLAALLSLVIPINLYFGKTPVHEPVLVFFILLSFLAYLYLKSSDKIQFKVWFILALIAAHLTTWAGFFLTPAITILTIFKRDNYLKGSIFFWLIPIIIFPAYMGFIYLHTGSLIGGDLLGVFLQRSSLMREIQPTDLNLVNYLARIRLWLFTLYSATLTLLVAVWFIFFLKRKLGGSDLQLLILGLFGVTYLIVFPNAAFIHNYLVFYLMPFFVLTGARVIWLLAGLKIIKKFSLLVPLVFLFIILLERKPYLDALNVSDADKLAVKVGKVINSQTLPSDTVLVSPVRFSYSAENFLKFYSDRRLIFADIEQLDYDYTVKVNSEQVTFQISKK